MEFNKSQEEAINTVNGALLIISCPGSGKTTTMLRRIEHMVDSGIPAHQILMVTFTEAAAKEMKSRFQANHTGSAVTFCTLHSLCLRVINESGARRGYHIADAQELNELVRGAVRAAGVYLEDLKRIKNDISRFKNTGDKKNRQEGDVNDKQFMSIVKYYEDQKERACALDFNDLLIVARTLLEDDATLRDRYAEQFKYIICDEYQDTNPIQKDILYLLARKYGNLCVVGDDDQSIYGFRGATPKLMLDFPKDFPDCKVIRMGTNYRSLPFIIEPSGKFIGYNKRRFDKDINAYRTGDGNIHFISTDTREGELERISELIKKAKANGTNLKDIAILARTNQELDDVAEVFIKDGIPFNGKEALSDIYESWMFTDICSYLKIADGRASRRDIMRIANRPKRYLDMRIMASCELSEDGIKRAYSSEKSYVSDSLCDFFIDLRALEKLPFEKRVDFILDVIGYRKYVGDYCKSAGASTTIHDNRLNKFRDESQMFTCLDEWLAYAKEHILKFREAIKNMHKDGVMLATMHRSKGLEWSTVFVIDCCDGNVPLVHGGKVSDIEEERRLFYVACTRAKNELNVMSYESAITSKGKKRDVSSSSFVSELMSICEEAKRKIIASENAKQRAAEELKEFSTKSFDEIKPGAIIHHDELGDGVVINVKPDFYSVRFKCGIKIFHAEGL